MHFCESYWLVLSYLSEHSDRTLHKNDAFHFITLTHVTVHQQNVENFVDAAAGRSIDFATSFHSPFGKQMLHAPAARGASNMFVYLLCIHTHSKCDRDNVLLSSREAGGSLADLEDGWSDTGTLRWAAVQ